MSTAVQLDVAAPAIRPFAAALCGVDGSAASLAAVRQALALRERGGTIELLAAAGASVPTGPVYGAGLVLSTVVDAARETLDDARELAPIAHGELVAGPAAAKLVEEAERTQATLIAVGARSLPRFVPGSVAMHLLHHGPCSVLIARPTPDDARFPRSIVVGDDGSAPAAAAVEVAHELADRFGVPLRVVSAAPPQAPVPTLLEASSGCDLLVVGSRGLHGLRAARSSVGLRVADRAACSVLVVRPRRQAHDGRRRTVA